MLNCPVQYAGMAARSTRIAVWGCGHGELDRVYEAVGALNAAASDGRPVELLICAGDFQSVRNEHDLATMACPPKYRRMNSFFRYYSGAARAPVPTIFVGGNHEASNHLQELPYGGWVAPNIFYLGRSGVVQFRGLRIAGISGIFKDRDFCTGYYERPPYDESAERSINHCREFDYAKLSLLKRTVDIVVGHDWPRGIEHYGDTAALLRKKPDFESDIRSGQLGNPASWQLLTTLRPRFWFAAHLHIKFGAIVMHPPRCEGAKSQGDNAGQIRCAGGSAAHGASPDSAVPGGSSSSASEGVSAQVPSPESPEIVAGLESAREPETTRFLALDKCLPGRAYLQVIDVPWRSGGCPFVSAMQCATAACCSTGSTRSPEPA